ncbi:hypothetical protein GCM10017620_22540 [Brevundimonas intermedia]|uniref:HTH HARE-type domain-containing protein n=1 Tax=Brevundimonas intermedia TaxID=74315 RepID=A0ABQ5T9L1_9CAUL|nr:hypothetical protein [Brevundimonas intermedia]GLK49281.1 hypothetical protein GCM10017620_22540 [Brevundimonas intermedia]
MNPLQQIRDKRAHLARQRAAIDLQDAELEVAEKVLVRLEAERPEGKTFELQPVQPGKNDEPRDTFAFDVPPIRLSRRELVLEALKGEKIWMTSAEINEEIAKRHGAQIKPTSFYPMLSNLKNEAVIKREGDRMALASRIEGEG